MRRKLGLLLIVPLAGGCFALFTLDEYGPETVAIGDGGAVDAPLDVVITEATADTAPLTGKIVFVSLSTYPVESADGIQGPSKADALCQLAAADAGLGGTFYAWLSNTAESPSTKFVGIFDASAASVAAGEQQLITMNNQLIAASYAELIASGPRVAINVTEKRMILPTAPPPLGGGQCPDGGLVWTGTGSNGKRATPSGGPTNPNCNDWQTSDKDTAAVAGRIAKHPTDWTSACFIRCNLGAHLYCFEQ